MDPSVLYPLLALVLWVGGVWGWLARGWWIRYRERKRDTLWTDADFEWLNSQTGES